MLFVALHRFLFFSFLLIVFVVEALTHTHTGFPYLALNNRWAPSILKKQVNTCLSEAISLLYEFSTGLLLRNRNLNKDRFFSSDF